MSSKKAHAKVHGLPTAEAKALPRMLRIHVVDTTKAIHAADLPSMPASVHTEKKNQETFERT